MTWWVIGLLGCATYTEDQFYTDYQEAYCTWAVGCGLRSDAEACPDQPAPPVTGCDFDADAAQERVDAIPSMPCTDSTPIHFPDACSRVHTNCGVDSGTAAREDSGMGGS